MFLFMFCLLILIVMFIVFFLMIRRPPRSTRTDTLFPYTTLFRSLHAAVVELVALEDAKIKYSTVQNWYPGDENGIGGIYNFVTKRAECRGARSKEIGRAHV